MKQGDLPKQGSIWYNVGMKASELIEKLRTAIDKYGVDCEVDMVEHADFGTGGPLW